MSTWGRIFETLASTYAHCSPFLLLLPPQGLTFPLLENANEYIVHGFAYNDYLKEVDPPTTIGRVGASLDKAFASESRGLPSWETARTGCAFKVPTMAALQLQQLQISAGTRFLHAQLCGWVCLGR